MTKELIKQFSINGNELQELEQAVKKKWNYFTNGELLVAFISLANEYRVHEKDLVQILIDLSKSEVSTGVNPAISMYTALSNKYVNLFAHTKLFTDCLVQFDLLLKNKEFLDKLKQETDIDFPERAVYTGNLIGLLFTINLTLSKEEEKKEKFLSVLKEFEYHFYYSDLLMKIFHEFDKQEGLYFEVNNLFLASVNS